MKTYLIQKLRSFAAKWGLGAKPYPKIPTMPASLLLSEKAQHIYFTLKADSPESRALFIRAMKDAIKLIEAEATAAGIGLPAARGETISDN
ncbi:MAG TPA: hypothetical protein VG347_24805 [Verrucomicrobiae bacterium]|nr:hypothetical protein [Verrucomicrobiae bacterium]